MRKSGQRISEILTLLLGLVKTQFFRITITITQQQQELFVSQSISLQSLENREKFGLKLSFDLLFVVLDHKNEEQD